MFPSLRSRLSNFDPVFRIKIDPSITKGRKISRDEKFEFDIFPRPARIFLLEDSNPREDVGTQKWEGEGTNFANCVSVKGRKKASVESRKRRTKAETDGVKAAKI